MIRCALLDQEIRMETNRTHNKMKSLVGAAMDLRVVIFEYVSGSICLLGKQRI
jgi:hypothetical protein